MKNRSNKYFLFVPFTLLLFAILSIITSSSKTQIENNAESFVQLKSEIQNEAEKIIHQKELNLIRIKSNFSSLINNSKKDTTDLLEAALSHNPNNILINIFSLNGNLIAWNYKKIINAHKASELIKTKKGEPFFLDTPLYVYLSIAEKINNYILIISIPIEAKFTLPHDKKVFSLKEHLEKIFEVELTFAYTPTTNKASIVITNSSNNIIGNIEVTKQPDFNTTPKQNTTIELLKSILLFISFLLLSLGLIDKIKPLGMRIKTITIIFLLLLGRYILFWLNITEQLGGSGLTNPIYFSSKFGNGIAKSPLELFITLLFSVGVAFVIRNYLSGNYGRRFNIFNSLFSILAFILLYNSFASTIKSVIFDSSILYFKDAELLGSYETTFMYLNVLLVGIIASILSVELIKITVNYLSSFSIDKKTALLITITILTVLLFVDEFIFVKSSFLMLTIFIIVTYAFSFYWIILKTDKYTGALFLLLASSIISISFLNFFNSELEKKSLKTIANEITRSNFELYEYYVEHACNIIKRNKSIIIQNSYPDEDYNQLAFLLWTKTKLGNEVQNSMINIIDINKNLLGSFSNNYFENYTWNWDEITPDSVLINSSENNGKKTIRAILPLYDKESIILYVEVIANYSGLEIDFAKKGANILGNKQLINISVNPKKLKIFEFNNGKLTNYYTDVFLTNSEKERLQNSVLKKNTEAWLNIVIDNENNLFYVKKIFDGNRSSTIAVGLRNQDLTWNLFDFFKVFFIHVIMILIFILLYSLFDFNRWKKIQISFKTKILFSLLIISIIPLILLAIYFKTISEGKNRDAINYKLGKRADNVEEYINRYYYQSDLNEFEIFDKAVTDLGINYSIFSGKTLIYSSEGNYYKAGLLPKIINPVAYIGILQEGLNEIIISENIFDKKFNTLYHKINFGNQTYIIKISDLFNSFQLPMSGIELNVILFGTYSLAIILIFILSTLLANQISSPIEKLTKATRSVSKGDMDIQIRNSETGEIYELIDGFNRMVQRLKKNQIALAEAERESAWREMAKQVAHEIKNPLTPMKLAVQHLIIAHKDNSEKFDSIFEKVTKTIINQIDILKNIASEFSNFAKMPNLKLSEINLIEIINETVNLFIEENCTITLSSDNNSLTLLSDKDQTERMFVNLIRNGIQAGADEIIISVKEKNDIITIEVKDNGKGIDNSIINNIFEENFTTKKSGMGLGLSMTKKFLRMIDGDISIKNSSEKGTIFLIEIKRK